MDHTIDLLGEDLERAAGEVQDGETLLDALAGESGAGGEAELEEHLVGLDVVADEAVFGGHLEDFVDLEHALTFNVDGAAFFVYFVVVVGVDVQ